MLHLYTLNQLKRGYNFIILIIVVWNSLILSTRSTITFTFEKVSQLHFVNVGSVVYLRCTLQNSSKVVFSKNYTTVLVEHLKTAGPSWKYTYQRQVPSHILSINVTDKNDSGRYFCLENTETKQLDLEVLYSPREQPRCTASCPEPCLNKLDGNGVFQFNCTIPDSNPTANASLSLNGATVANNETGITIHDGENQGKVLSYTTNVDNLPNNSLFYCKITQERLLQNKSYNASCFYGPLIILPCKDLVSPSGLANEKHTTIIMTDKPEIMLKVWGVRFTVSLLGFVLLIFLAISIYQCRMVSKAKSDNGRGRNDRVFQNDDVSLNNMIFGTSNDLNTHLEIESTLQRENQCATGMEMVHNVAYEYHPGECFSGMKVNEIYESANRFENNGFDSETNVIYSIIAKD